MRKTLQPNICFIGVGPDSGVGSADGANSGGNRGNALDADFGGRGGYLGQDPNGSGVGVFGTGTDSSGGGSATNPGNGEGGILGSNVGTENSSGQQGNLSLSHAASIAAQRTLTDPTSYLPGMGLANFAVAMSELSPDSQSGNANNGGGGNGDGPLAQPPAPAPAPVPDPVAPAQQTISAPDSPEQQIGRASCRERV